MFTESFKKSKNKMRSSDTAQTGLVTLGTFGPLGVKLHHIKPCVIFFIKKEFKKSRFYR
jgi:hypothetical protein